MNVTSVIKKRQLPISSIIKYQILTYCFLHEITVSNKDLEALVVVASLNKKIELNHLCNELCDLNIFETPQSARNSLGKLEKKNILVKSGSGRKSIELSPSLQIVSTGNILLDYKFLYRENI